MAFVRFTVIGRGLFPTDMLRYDECFPIDGGAAEALMDRDYTRERKTGRSARLICRSPEAWTKPTRERWASFGWFVDPESVSYS